MDPSEEEKLRKKSWSVGKLNENYLCWEAFTQQPSSSTSMDSQKILRLEEEIRQSREENQRL